LPFNCVMAGSSPGWCFEVADLIGYTTVCYNAVLNSHLCTMQTDQDERWHDTTH
jgi:hypothetical protein